MEFYIKKDSVNPILLLDIVNDGRSESYKNLNSILDNSTIRFSMKRESDGIQKIFMNNSHITDKIQKNPDAPKEYYIYYKWDEKDTNQKGRYVGEFSILTEEGELIVPIREKLYINIV